VTPKESLHRDYGLLTRFLRSLSLRFQLRATLEFLLLFASGSILVLLGTLFVFELGKAFPYLPFLYSLAAIIFLAFLVFMGLWRSLSRPSRGRVARNLEEKFPELKDDVTNSLLLFDQLTNGEPSNPISKGLIRAHLKKTVEAISSIHPRQVVSLKKALGHLRILLPLMVAFSIVFAIDPTFVNRSLALILHPFSNMPVQKTFISVEPKGSVILRGSPFIIRALAEGYVPKNLALSIWPEGGEAKRMTMETEGNGRFVYQIESVQSSFRFQAYHGGSASPIYGVRVVDPPDPA